MQAEDMEVPIINNLNDSGDRQRPRGKDVFKDQQKESEVNPRGVCVQSAAAAHGTGAHWRRDVCVCVFSLLLLLLLLGSFQISAECPFHAVSWLGSMYACGLAGRQAGRQGGVILATGSYK